MKVIYTPDAEADVNRLEKHISRRIVDKIDWFAMQSDPLHFAQPLQNADDLYRFRVGAYRVLFTLREDRIVILLVLAVRHRREAYR